MIFKEFFFLQIIDSISNKKTISFFSCLAALSLKECLCERIYRFCVCVHVVYVSPGPPPPLSLGGWKTVHLVSLLCQRAYLHHFINIPSQPDLRWPDVFVIALLIEAVPSVKNDSASFTGMIFFCIKKLPCNFSCI